MLRKLPNNRRTHILALMCAFYCVLFSYASLDTARARIVMQERFGSVGVQSLIAWEEMIDDSHGLDTPRQLKQVNDFLNNHIRFDDDLTHWKQADYWATPLETLGSGAGDCEDFTIAKYISLLKLGIPSEKLRLIYVKAQIGGTASRVFQAHMVLGYYPQPDAVPLILDNLETAIEPANKRSDLQPIFSFNSDGLWVGNQIQPQIDPTARLSRWRDVLSRIKQEGF